MSDRIYHVLVLCTGNSARSIMAEGLLNALCDGRVRAYSAGSRPTGKVNPLGIEQLAAAGYPTAHLRSKSWEEFAAAGAPQMDLVITVCDNAAGEACPLWPGQPLTAHWSFADPAAASGSLVEQRAAFSRIFRQIRQRVGRFAELPLAKLDRAALQRALDDIGRSPLE